MCFTIDYQLSLVFVVALFILSLSLFFIVSRTMKLFKEAFKRCKDTFVYGNSMVCHVQSQKVSEGIEIQIVLGYQVLIQEMVCEEVVSDIIESELENTKEKPSIAVVFAKEGECIWEIGKKYQVSVDTIVSMNEGILMN